MKRCRHLLAHFIVVRLASAAALLVSFEVHGQGTVTFSNGRNAPVGTLCEPNGFMLAPAGTTFSVALYFAPNAPGISTPPDPSTFTQVGAAAFLVGPGVYDAGIRTAPITPPGGLGWFQVKAWATAYGTTYEQAVANGGNLLGVSNMILIPTGNPSITPATSPHPLTGISGISFFVDPPPHCVPEPSEVLLGLLAAATLCSLRQKVRTD
jgi:hypothetical protein